MPNIVVISTTIDDKIIATNLIKGLLDAKLIACAQTMNIESSYWWENKIEQSSEFSLVFKLLKRNADHVIEFISQNHSYEVPEIMVEEKQTTPSYHQYCLEVCT